MVDLFTSSVFANAESLFYYARDPRSGRKVLTLEEIQALFARNREPAASSTIVNHNAKECMVESKVSQSKEELQDLKHEEVSKTMVGISEEKTSTAGNLNIPAVLTVMSPNEPPTNQDQQASDILSLKHEMQSADMQASAKRKLPPLRVSQHLSIEDEGLVKSQSAEFEASSPLQKTPSDGTETAQTTEAIKPQSVDEHRFPIDDGSLEAIAPTGNSAREASLDDHSNGKLHDARPKLLLPSAAHEQGELIHCEI